MLERRGILNLVLGICVLNGIFSPVVVVALQIAPVLMPELFPRTVSWALFFSSILLSTGTLLLSGIPAALYDRLVRPGPEATTALWIWLAAAVFLSLPALQNLGGTF